MRSADAGNSSSAANYAWVTALSLALTSTGNTNLNPVGLDITWLITLRGGLNMQYTCQLIPRGLRLYRSTLPAACPGAFGEFVDGQC